MRLASLVAALLLASACASQQRPADGPADPLATVSGEELFRRASLLAGAGDYTRAEQYLLASMDRGVAPERAVPALMSVCVRASRLVAALGYAEPFLAQHPEDWPLRLLVASIHMGLDQPLEARRELRTVLDTATDEPPEAHYFLAVIYRDSLGAPDRGRDHFARYLALAPDGEHAEEARAELPEQAAGPRRLTADEAASLREEGAP